MYFPSVTNTSPVPIFALPNIFCSVIIPTWFSVSMFVLISFALFKKQKL